MAVELSSAVLSRRWPSPEEESGIELNVIASALSAEDIRLDLEVADRNALFEAIGTHMEREHGLSQHLIAHCLFRREQAGSTALGKGVAIPHARIEGLDRTRAVYVRLKPPIAFGAADRQPVSDALFLLVPHPAADAHLKLLAAATQMFSDERFRQDLHASRSAEDVLRLFSERTEEPRDGATHS